MALPNKVRVLLRDHAVHVGCLVLGPNEPCREALGKAARDCNNARQLIDAPKGQLALLTMEKHKSGR